jgi:hypothetical protein
MWQCQGRGRWDDICKRDPKLYACVGDAPALTDKGWWRPSSGGGGGKPSGGGDKPSGGGGGADPGGGDRPSGGGDDPSGSGGGGGSEPYKPGPSMKMYFFNQMPFWLLFKEWTPSTTPELVGAWFAIFFLGVFFELVQVSVGERLGGWCAGAAARDGLREPQCRAGWETPAGLAGRVATFPGRR